MSSQCPLRRIQRATLPCRSDGPGEDEDEDTDPEDVGEMDIEGWDAIEKFPFKDSKEII